MVGFGSGSSRDQRVLDLSNRNLTRIPDEVWQMHNLHTLILAANQITTLQPEIVRLTKLTTLDLSGNRLASLPVHIGQLAGLKTLKLANNGLKTVSAGIGGLTLLQELHLPQNEVTELPQEIGSLANLKVLDLSGNRLTSLRREIGKLTSLRTLKVTHNALTSLPTQIGFMTGLLKLDLAHNRLTELPPEIGKLTALTEMDVSHNELTSLPPHLGMLAALNTLNAENNCLTALPAQIGQLTNLANLFLDRNEIAELPTQIGQLTNLHTLYLYDNQLAELPQSLAGLLRLGLILHLSGNPLPEVISAAIKQGREHLAIYLDSLGDSAVVFEAKTVLVGEGAVGKTSLLAALRDERFVVDRSMTHGIEVRDLQVPHPRIDNQIITVRMWDFGGQEIYQITHQFFFSPRALFLLAWHPRHGAKLSDVEGWMRRIRLRVASDAIVILVATYGKDGRGELDYNGLDHKFPGLLAGSYTIDSSPPALGIAELKTAIATHAAALPNMGQMISRRWIKVREAIDKIAARQPQISYAEFRKICRDHQIMERDEALALAEIMHDLGQIIYYGSDHGLRDVVVLNPEWLTKAISGVLKDDQTVADKGVLNHARLAEIWDPDAVEFGWDADHYPYFLRLMEKFDISYRLEDGQRSLVAQMVPYERPIDLPWDFRDPVAQGQRRLRLICELSDEAPGLLAWLTVRHHQASIGKHWRKGLFLRNPTRIYGSEALLEAIDSELWLEVRSPSPKMYFYFLCTSIELLMESRWPGLEYKLMIPCPGVARTGGACTNRFPVEGLDNLAEQGKLGHTCLTCGTEHVVTELLAGFPQPVQPWDAALDRLTEAMAKGLQRMDTLAQVVTETALLVRMLLRNVSNEVRDCPRLFTLIQQRRSFMAWITGASATYQLTLWCEHPDHWHPVPEATYDLDEPQKWLTAIAPYATIVLKALRIAVPILSAGLSGKLEMESPWMRQLEQMKNLLDGLPPTVEVDDSAQSSGLTIGEGGLTHAVGRAARTLYRILLDKDPNAAYGDMARVGGEDGEELWVCKKHFAAYHPGLPKVPLSASTLTGTAGSVATQPSRLLT